MLDRRSWIVPVVVAMFAMAIGLVLGSGPLRTALIGSLGTQVESLEDQVDAAERSAEEANIANDYGAAYIDATAPGLLNGALDGHVVATVAVDAADTDDLGAIELRFQEAGAKLGASVAIEPTWSDPNQSAFRAALAPQLAISVAGLDGTESVDEVFAHALAQALMPDRFPEGVDSETGVTGPDGEVGADRAEVLWTLLADAELVSGTRTEGADAVALVAGEAVTPEDATQLQATSSTTLAQVFAEYDVAIVAANGPEQDGDLASAIIKDPDDLGARISTVTWINTPYSQVSVALALQEQFAGWVGHYGPGEGRDAAPPPPAQTS